MCSTSTASIKTLIRGRGAGYKDPFSGTSKIVMSTGKLVFLKAYKVTNILFCVIFNVFYVLEIKSRGKKMIINISFSIFHFKSILKFWLFLLIFKEKQSV